MRFIQYMMMGVVALLAGCGPSQLELTQRNVDYDLLAAESALQTLNGQIESGTLRNALLLPTYANKAREIQPEFTKIIDVLESEGSKKGPTYLQLVKRISDVKGKMPLNTVNEAGLITEELSNIRTAIGNYDAMLVDALNVLSGFSGGALPKIRELEFEGSGTTSGAVGSEYVGNSNYGQWRNNSSGGSFWQWYGQYAFFSTMFRGPVRYDSWSSSRSPSYYHDRSQGAYSTQASRNNNAQALSRTKKTYASQGKSFQSPYAKSTSVKGVAGSTKKSSYAQRSSNSSKSPYAKKSTSSSYSKSSYNSRSSSSSRSSYGGK